LNDHRELLSSVIAERDRLLARVRELEAALSKSDDELKRWHKVGGLLLLAARIVESAAQRVGALEAERDTLRETLWLIAALEEQSCQCDLAPHGWNCCPKHLAEQALAPAAEPATPEGVENTSQQR